MISSKQVWSVAGVACQSAHRDAYLLVIDNAQEQSAVAEMLESLDRQFMTLCLVFVFVFSHILLLYLVGCTYFWKKSLYYLSQVYTLHNHMYILSVMLKICFALFSKMNILFGVPQNFC